MTSLLAWALGALLVGTGIAHFVVPRYFVTLVPPWLPRPRVLVLVSGVVEVVVGAALIVEPTRTIAAWLAFALIGTYVLTHLDAFVRSSADRPRWLDRPFGAVARVVVNLAYLAAAGAFALTA